MFLFLTLSVTDACYGNRQPAARPQHTEHLGSYRELIESLQQLMLTVLNNCLFLLLHTSLDLKRRMALERSILCLQDGLNLTVI